MPSDGCVKAFILKKKKKEQDVGGRGGCAQGVGAGVGSESRRETGAFRADVIKHQPLEIKAPVLAPGAGPRGAEKLRLSPAVHLALVVTPEGE